MDDPAPPALRDMLDDALESGQRLAIDVIEYPADKRDEVMQRMGGFCHVSRRLQRVARPESSDYAICMMPIAMRACWRK